MLYILVLYTNTNMMRLRKQSCPNMLQFYGNSHVKYHFIGHTNTNYFKRWRQWLNDILSI